MSECAVQCGQALSCCVCDVVCGIQHLLCLLREGVNAHGLGTRLCVRLLAVYNASLNGAVQCCCVVVDQEGYYPISGCYDCHDLYCLSVGPCR